MSDGLKFERTITADVFYVNSDWYNEEFTFADGSVDRGKICRFADAFGRVVREEGEREFGEQIRRISARLDEIIPGVERMKAEVASLTAERDALRLELKRMEDAWMQDETIGITNGQDDGTLRPSVRKTVERAERAESAIGEARALILDEARARALLTVRYWPGVGTKKLNELDDAILALKAEDSSKSG